MSNIWISQAQGLDRAVAKVADWFRRNADRYDQRALLAPQKNNLRSPKPALAQYISNKNVGSRKGTQANAGGPVLAYVPTLEVLEDAIHLADGQALGVVEWVPGEMSGWAAATNALDLETGEPTPGVPPDIAAALEDLHRAGYNGYGRSKETYFKNLYTPPIRTLVESGYAFDFVASYLVALGRHASSMDDLKKIYK
ncbi:hypothetical protein [Nocardia cyriacigeorgica]|uniref:hypothetical protein n=1 Tax=Nocardia cyriacigeorgica TaxID=135487 RepID=UPI002454AC56|nr:hypothetical protein [Nocardia cyriacigeorgica]